MKTHVVFYIYIYAFATFIQVNLTISALEHILYFYPNMKVCTYVVVHFKNGLILQKTPEFGEIIGQKNKGA